MFTYYIGLGIRGVKRNWALSLLIVLASAIGISASMTALTVFRAMSSDPIPNKSSKLFTPQIDIWGPEHNAKTSSSGDSLPEQLSYTDASGLMIESPASLKAAMYSAEVPLTPPDSLRQPFNVTVRATYTSFFKMFDVPYKFGTPWSDADDANHAEVVVISREINDKVCGGTNSVGQSLPLDNRSYRVVGVLDYWQPLPKFYDLNQFKYGTSEDVFMPFTRAIDAHLKSTGNFNCASAVGDGWEGRIHSDCVWIQFWAWLPNAGSVEKYREFLNGYAADQQRLGRFRWSPHTNLQDVRHWLSSQRVVTDEIRILLLVSFSFLFVCLLNAMGIMLARLMSRASEISVRRALGANRKAIFVQYLVESGVVGFAGSLLGLLFTLLGLLGLRIALSVELSRLTYLDLYDVGIAVVSGIAATVFAGLYPTWRASRIPPGLQLKAK